MNEKQKSISNYKVLAISLATGFVPFLTAIFVTFLTLGSRKTLEWDAEVNPTMINGILTGTAVVFAFVTFELRRIFRSWRITFMASLPLVFFLTWTVDYYFIDAVTLGYATVSTMITATINFFFNIFYFIAMLLLANYLKIESEEP